MPAQEGVQRVQSGRQGQITRKGKEMKTLGSGAMKGGVGTGKKSNMVSNKTVSQAANGGGKSANQNTAVGSGSRPSSSRIKIESSNPNQTQMIRPKNKIEGTGFKG